MIIQRAYKYILEMIDIEKVQDTFKMNEKKFNDQLNQILWYLLN